MSTNKNYIRETSKDFDSISQDLVASMTNITDEWVPADETDPGVVYLKIASMLGDMLSYNRDRGTMAMFPETVTERQDAYKLFKSLGYFMPWYNSAKCNATINVKSVPEGTTFILPRYTVFQTKTNSIKYTYCGKQLSVSNRNASSHSTVFSDTYQNPISSIKIEDIELIQGEAVTPPIVTQYKIPIGKTKAWHESYGYNVTVTDVKNDLYISIPNNKIDQDSITLIDSNGNEWEQVENLSQVEYGKYFELYINSYNSAYIKLSVKPSSVNVTAFKLFYILTDGYQGRITLNSLSDYPLTPTYTFDGVNYTIVNSNVSISNDPSEGGYDYETAEEAREKFAKMGSNLKTLVTLSDFENDAKTVDGVDQCIAYDLNRYSESCTEYLFNYTDNTKKFRRRIYLSSSYDEGTLEQRFGPCYLWLSSIRIYCGNDLIFSGCGRPLDVPEGSEYSAEYVLFYKVDTSDTTKRIKVNDTNLYVAIGNDETDPFFDIVFDVGETPSECPYGVYWIEYMIDRDPHKVGINYVLNDDKVSTPGKSTITSNIDAEISDKKHVYLESYVYSKPYYIYWSPEGKLYTPQMTLDESKSLLTNVDLYLKEKYKSSVMEYGKQIDRASVEESIKDVTSYYLIESSNIAYSIKIDSTDENGIPTNASYYFTPEKINSNTLSKSVTITFSNVTMEETSVNNEVYYKADLFFGENFVIVPNTVSVIINHGDIVFNDTPRVWDRDELSSETTWSVGANTNMGVLVSEDPYAASNDDITDSCMIFYDTVGRLIDEKSFYNLSFALKSGYYYNEPIDVQITFDVNWDFICKYNNYDPNKLYIAPASIRRYDV